MDITIDEATLHTDTSASILNNNAQFSRLSISSNMDDANYSDLSITMDTQEKNALHTARKNQENNRQSDGFTMPDESTAMELTLSSPQMSPSKQKESETLENQITSMHLDDTTDLEQKITDNTDEYYASVTTPETNSSITIDERSFFQHSIIELGRRLWKSEPQKQHYLKGCIWSPDGTCLLVPVNLDGMHVIELPTDLYNNAAITERTVSKLESAVHVKEGGTVYDVAWFPFMDSNAPETCCWLATRQHEPIHLWDAFHGDLRCSYRGYDAVDEIETAISVAFSNDGQKIFGGYKKTIKIFDTNIPGRDYSTIPVKQAISCFASAATKDDNNTITVGTWSGYIQHYDLRAPKFGPLFTLGSHANGITLLRYTPNENDWMLYSGARKDNKIFQWDMRNYSKPVRVFERLVATNQRVYFDLSPQLQWLATGSTDGRLLAWDLLGKNADLELNIHADCCNCVSFHPTRPILATSSGQYHFIDFNYEEREAQHQLSQTEEIIVDYENALLLLWCGPISQ